MKSIKPGRGPSMMAGVVGIFMVCFGIFWTVMAAQTFPFMAVFGVLWTGIAIATTVYNFKNAKSKNRYSQYDITDEGEEPDPFNERFAGNGFERWSAEDETPGSRFCPYCGAKAKPDFEFCNKCGKRLP